MCMCMHGSGREWLTSQLTRCRHLSFVRFTASPTPTPFVLLDRKALGSLFCVTDLILESRKLPGERTEGQVQGRKLRLKGSQSCSKGPGHSGPSLASLASCPAFLSELALTSSYIVRFLNFATPFLTFRTLHLLFIPSVWTRSFPPIPL